MKIITRKMKKKTKNIKNRGKAEKKNTTKNSENSKMRRRQELGRYVLTVRVRPASQVI